jgi:hypothetical protein
MAIWYILWSFGVYFSVLVCCTKKNLATLLTTFSLYFGGKKWREKKLGFWIENMLATLV